MCTIKPITGREGHDAHSQHDDSVRPPRRARGAGRRRPSHARRHGHEGQRQQGAGAEGRQDPRRLRGRLRGRIHAVREVRGEARALSRQPAAGCGRAGERLAVRPRAAAPRGPAGRGGQGARLRDLGLGRADRARRRGPGDRLWRELRARCGAGALDGVGSRRQGHRTAGPGDRGGDLRVHQHAYHDSGALMAEPTRTPDDAAAPPTSPPAPPKPPGQEDELPWLEELPPRKIVAELDRYIVGQDVAKKAVAIAVRNRWRRAQAPDDIRDEILPNNIIMIGPTGVGKTEIARRLARLAGAPFLRVEASKFTEVGYVGRDVESMVRELVDVAINMVRTEREDDVYPQAETRAEERLLDLLLPPTPTHPTAAPPHPPQGAGSAEQGAASRPLFVVSSKGDVTPAASEADVEAQERRRRTREKLRQQLKEGKLEERDVEVEVQQQSFPGMEMMQPPQGMEGPDFNFTEWLQEMLPKKKKRRTVHVHEARRILVDEELKKLVDMDDVVNEALDRVENHGVIFIDEIDKIAGERGTVGPDVSREGVQRDLLPIVEGSTVQTRYGYVRTDHILFIAAGAFHVSK